MAEIKQLKEGNKVIYPLTSINAIVGEDGNKISVPTKTSQLTNDSGYISVIQNLLKNTNFGDGLNGWTKSGSVTIKNDVYEGIGAAYIDGGGMIGQDVTLDVGVYTLSFRVANGSISREWPLKVLLRRANVSNVVTNAEGWNNDDIPTIAVTSVSDKVYITFTLALASNINIEFENSRYGCLVDSIRLEEGDTATPYDEYLMQKRLVSGLNISTVNGQSLLDGGDITISGGGGLKNVINFGIKDYGIFEADKGMTWSDWCDSKYNTIGLSCTLLQVSLNGGQNNLSYPGNYDSNVNPNDIVYPTLYFAI